jgi:hypothetical protein
LPRPAAKGETAILVTAPIASISAGRARFIQSLLLAVLYILIYWMLSADTFGEKWSEPATLLGTSFFIDINRRRVAHGAQGEDQPAGLILSRAGAQLFAAGSGL